MAKAIREIKPLLKLIDVVIEIVDARAPMSSSNPIISDIAQGKSSVMLLNKSDLADPSATKAWIVKFQASGRKAVASDVLKGTGLDLALSSLAAFQQKARIKPRALVIGMPNVGKSSLINRYAKRSKTKTGDKPGVTRGKQWIDIGSAELLDTPGLMPLRVDNPDVWNRLCALGMINDDLFVHEQVAKYLVGFVASEYAGVLEQRYGITKADMDSPGACIEAIAKKRGCLLQGGVIDEEKAYMMIIRDLRSGRLGRISLERPASVTKVQ